MKSLLFLFLVVLSHAETNDHEIKKAPHEEKRSTKPSSGSPDGEGCGVDPGDLASVANGENSNLSPVILYLTAPQCINNRLNIARSAIAKGVQFNQMPFRLEQMAKTYSLGTLQSAKRLDSQLRRLVPQIMEEHPLTVQEQVPLVAQFSILSPSTGTWALGNLIKDELVASQPSLGKETQNLEELAKNLIQMGATENVVVNELMEIVEDMAILSQADALGKVLKGLAGAAGVEGALVPVFNAAANAFQRGVEKGKNNYNKDQVRSLTSAGLDGAKEAIQGNSLLNSGISDLNEAFRSLLEGKSIETVSLKALWQEIIKALAVTPLLPNLADMMATSFTPQVVFLPEKQRKIILLASRNYPQIAFALQKNLLVSWDQAWESVHKGEASTLEFNEQREKFFKPLANELLENDIVSLEDHWIYAVLKRGLVKDEVIEKRFPAFVLGLFERREKALNELSKEPNLEGALSSFAESLSVLWSLNRVYIPALRKWVIKYDE